MYNDASYNGLGCVLMQDGKVISYASWKLKLIDSNKVNNSTLEHSKITKQASDVYKLGWIKKNIQQ